MKFYDRENELHILTEMHSRSLSSAKMTVLYGRRRIGKTSLALQAVQDLDYVYFFVTRKSEVLLCQDYLEEIQQSLRIRVFGEFTRFRDVFAYLTDLSKSKPFTLIIDEFQEFSFINPAIFSEMQEIWDRSKGESRMHLIISGSVYRLMKKIFENAKEPLFGRADERIHLQPFGPGTLLEIIRDFHESFEPIDLLCFYCVTGGVPKYVELLADKNALSIEQIRDELFRPNSFWLVEGKTLLIEEFGKDYTIYFSILSLIASGKTGRTEIESVLEKNIGGYLERLINDFEVIRVVKPIFTKPLGQRPGRSQPDADRQGVVEQRALADGVAAERGPGALAERRERQQRCQQQQR
jgi:AAA+ ATPase superfamily predicted ATPase